VFTDSVCFYCSATGFCSKQYYTSTWYANSYLWIRNV